MGDVIRALGILSAAFALGCLYQLGRARPGTTGFAVPWRYWAVGAGVMVEVSGIVARISLWGETLNPRDIMFIVINVCIIVACLGTLQSPPPRAPDGP